MSIGKDNTSQPIIMKSLCSRGKVRGGVRSINYMEIVMSPKFGAINSSSNFGDNPLVCYKSGSGTLVLGTATIEDTGVTANSVIIVSRTGAGGILTGVLRVASKSVGVGFTVTSSSLIDTSTFDWVRMELL